MEEMGGYAVARGNIPTLRIPALVKTIPMGLMCNCKFLFSLELSENVTQMKRKSMSCRSLRNVALPSTTDINIEDGVFEECPNLLQVFDSEEHLIHSLKHRFDTLPIHKMIYYQSYTNMTVDQLDKATNISISRRRRKVDPSGSLPDCLGMTPLHIMACSSLQDIELYNVLVTKFPETLVTEDRWGAVPLFYAVWRDAPREIIQFLKENYKSIYPNYEFNWTEMMATLSKAKVPNNAIRTLLDLYIEFIPNQVEEWITELANHKLISLDTFKVLVQYGYTERVNAIGLKQFRDKMIKELKDFGRANNKAFCIYTVRSIFTSYEAQYNQLKEATTILELALWKYKMDESESNKKRKRTEEPDSDFREQCRVSCSADIVIEHVLPFLVPGTE